MMTFNSEWWPADYGMAMVRLYSYGFGTVRERIELLMVVVEQVLERNVLTLEQLAR
jgi:hypothetical protein